MAKKHPSWRSGAGVLLIPVRSTELGVVGGVEQNDGMTFKKARRYATRHNHVTSLT